MLVFTRISVVPLKGGLFLYSLSQNFTRPTKDKGFLGKQVSNDMAH